MAILRTPTGPATLLQDSVVIRDSATLLLSGRALIQESQGKAALTEKVFISTPSALIWSDSVVYDFKKKIAKLFANKPNEVLIKQESTEIRAPEIEFSLSNRLIIAPQNVKIYGTQKGEMPDYEITGRHGFYDLNLKLGVVDSEPVLQYRKTDQEQPVTLTAKRFLYFQDKGVAKAEGAVCVRSEATIISADTLLFFLGADSGVAWGAPMAQDTNGEARGEMLIFKTPNRSLREVTFCGSAEGKYKTSAGEKVEVKGKTITLLLTHSTIDQIEITHLSSGRLIRKLESR